LLCLAVARLHGAGALIMAGLSVDTPRLDLAIRLGATHTVDLQTQDLAEVLRGIGDGYGADLVIDAAGVSASFHTAMDAVRPMGQITKVGWGPAPLGVSLDPIVGKAVTVAGSFSHTYRTWERVIGLLSSGQLDVSPLIGLETTLDNWREGFDGMHEGRMTKAVLVP
ncbi:MAG TPA: zinc-binding dehydrogenase, partial [Chloroflexota bacterium]